MPHCESPTAEVLRTGVPLRNQELVIGRPDGTRVSVLASVVPVRDTDGSMIGAVSCLQDITDRKRAEEKLQATNTKLQLMSCRLVESQETERRHIARELHDEVGQTLTVAEMNLQALLQSGCAAPVTRRLQESLQAVERVLEQVRDLSLSLRPSMLDDLGLDSALRWYTNRQAALAGLQAEFQTDALEDRLDPFIETTCFRVAQEALTNVVRHARAHSVTLALRKRNGHLHLFVRDDGVGFDVAAVRHQAVQGASLGLLSMEERATLVEGVLELKSVPGQGTEVHAWFPLKWRTTSS
jgi:signal transduction histidine kinase